MKNNTTKKLTPREKECIQGLMRGMTMKQIAANLTLSPRTISFYLNNAKNKLGCYNRADLIQRVVEEGMLWLGFV